jgi:hypothetical protein
MKYESILYISLHTYCYMLCATCLMQVWDLAIENQFHMTIANEFFSTSDMMSKGWCLMLVSKGT